MRYNRKYNGFRKVSYNDYQKPDMRRIVFVSSDEFTTCCWRFVNERYPMLNGRYLHQEWVAVGEGEVVRHLCGDSRCVNPMHLRRGSDIENAYDEIKVRSFSIQMWSMMLKEDYSHLDDTVAYLVLRAKMGRLVQKEGKSSKDINNEAREMFRQWYEIALSDRFSKGDISYDEKYLINVTRERFRDLNSHKDLVVYTQTKRGDVK